ncbi:MAG TPA: iron-containing alcohol dehydrogenase, partial [archaeon]|nr:iron-containing alcohol dehydrogenase [archaeon]
MTRFTPTMLKVEKMERTWNPVSVFFGNNSSKLLGYTLELLQSKNVFLVTDKFLYENTSMVKDLESVLDDYQITRDVYKNVQPEPKLEVAEDIANAVRK